MGFTQTLSSFLFNNQFSFQFTSNCSFSTASLKAVLPKLSVISMLKSLTFLIILLTVLISPFSHASTKISLMSG